MFDYKSESIAWSITAENTEMRESLLKQELLATQISLENAEMDTKRLDWLRRCGAADQPGDAVAVAIGGQLVVGKDGREAIDGAMKL